MASTQDLIRRLDRWLSDNRPEYYSNLLPGLTEEELSKFEHDLGVPLPDDFKILYRWRNGQSSDCYDSLDSGQFMPAAEVIESWRYLNDLKEGGDFPEEDWWYREWIPFLAVGGGDNLCLDTAGVPIGHPGQIIDFCHEDSIRHIEYSCLNKWLETMVVLYEEGYWAREDEPDYWQNCRAFVAVMNPGYPIEVLPAIYPTADSEGAIDEYDQIPVDPETEARLRKEAEQFRLPDSSSESKSKWWQIWR